MATHKQFMRIKTDGEKMSGRKIGAGLSTHDLGDGEDRASVPTGPNTYTARSAALTRQNDSLITEIARLRAQIDEEERRRDEEDRRVYVMAGQVESIRKLGAGVEVQLSVRDADLAASVSIGVDLYFRTGDTQPERESPDNGALLTIARLLHKAEERNKQIAVERDDAVRRAKELQEDVDALNAKLAEAMVARATVELGDKPAETGEA